MQCPTCQVTLQITDRQGIEIDYCPQCRGIWLDRGELEKLIDRSAGRGSSAASRHSDDESHFDRGDRDRDEHDGYQGQPRKRESWLGRLLDFD